MKKLKLDSFKDEIVKCEITEKIVGGKAPTGTSRPSFDGTDTFLFFKIDHDEDSDVDIMG